MAGPGVAAPADAAVCPAFAPADVLAAMVARGQMDGADAGRVGELARSTGSPLAVVADRLGLVSQADWAEETGRLAGLAVVRLDEIPDPLPEVDGLNRSFLAARSVVPLQTGAGAWRFATADPSDGFAVKALAVAAPGPVVLAVATFRDIEAALARQVARADAGIVVRDLHRDQQDADYLVELANDVPTIKLVDRIFATALEREASDIHLEVFERATRLRFRVDGVLIEQPAVPVDLYAGVVSRLKILAGLDIAERRLPQDGRIRHRSHGRELDLRVATAPSIHGEAMALRILNYQTGLKALADLQMPAAVRALFDWGLGQRNGLILVTGPTGSGKTTTLHAALAQLNTIGRKIVSVENPVEIQVPGVIQVEANGDIGLDFPRALRSFLRHDPDVMMVGEIRDRETAEVAIQAALTGHLVLSTLHTNDAPSAVTRLEDMGVDRFLIDAVLRLAAAQRLVRVLCVTCKRPSQQGQLGARLIVRFSSSGADRCGPAEAVGCPACGGTGYRGRRALFEAVAGARLARGAEPATFPTLRDHAIALVATGVTSAEEALRVVDLAAVDLPA